MKIIDTHAHYNDKKFSHDRDTLLAALPERSIEAVINVGYNLQSSRISIQLAEKFPHVYAAVGVHPHDARTFCDNMLETMRRLAKKPKVVAYGEIGLDYYRNLSPRDMQQTALRKQLILAQKLKLPAIIHDRDAHDDCLAITDEFPDLPMVFHCYSGDAGMARNLIKRGRMISFTANITYSKAHDARDSVLAAGLENIMLETDCPYMAPQSHRGQRNDSTLMFESVRVIADWLGCAEEEVAKATTANAKRFFGI